MGCVNAQFRTGSCDPLSVEILSESSEEPYVSTQQRQIVGNISPHTAQTDRDSTGVGIGIHQGSKGTAANVHIHAANNHSVAAGANNIAFSGNVAFLAEIGDVYRYGAAGDAQRICQSLLGDHGIRFDHP